MFTEEQQVIFLIIIDLLISGVLISTIIKFISFMREVKKVDKELEEYQPDVKVLKYQLENILGEIEKLPSEERKPLVHIYVDLIKFYGELNALTQPLGVEIDD